MKIKISELEGAALDWAVALVTGETLTGDSAGNNPILVGAGTDDDLQRPFWPSTDWSQGGPLIERFGTSVSYYSDGHWIANVCESQHFIGGETALIAAMRAIVAAHTDGDTVEVPDELVEVNG